MTYQQETPEEKLPLSMFYGAGKVAYFVIFGVWAVVGFIVMMPEDAAKDWWRILLGLGCLFGPGMIVFYPVITFAGRFGENVDKRVQEWKHRNGWS